ncbi:MAG TPA: APC family permease [Anaerolineales bacterium]|nr:APC family permease [Anaerolineales bacterium]
MATATATPEVFTRKASGLVRVMSPYSAFIYNILTMGLIFPWTYLWAPGALPGGNLFWGIILAMILELPLAFAYVWLATAMPRTGGDYVFQSRVFGGAFGYTVLMSGFVIWILQWEALSGWLMANVGIAPLFIGLGATLNLPSLTGIGVWAASAWGTIIISIANAGLAYWLLISGFKNYVKFQYVMWYGILIAFLVMLGALLTVTPDTFPARIDAFADKAFGTQNFFATAIAAARDAGADLTPPFNLLSTILIAPIAWTSLQWATYSVEQNGEIKNARSFRAQTFVLVGSMILTGILLAVLGWAFERAIGTEFLYTAGAGYWLGVAEAKFQTAFLWPNIVAIAIAATPLVVLLIGFGYILNSFQIVCNCMIGMTRVMVAMSLDRLLPEWFSKVDEKRHTPVNAHLAYFLGAIPVILVYNLWGSWTALTLGVTFACGYVFVLSSLAAALLPYRAKEIYEASPGAKYKLGDIPWVTILGALGFILGGAMVLMFMFYPALGLTSTLAYTVVFGVLIVSALMYYIAKYVQKQRGIDVGFAFKEIPPE